MDTSAAWLASIGGDLWLLGMEYVPELLLISLLSLLFRGIRRGLRRDARSTL